jgi:hypothetical protein
MDWRTRANQTDAMLAALKTYAGSPATGALDLISQELEMLRAVAAAARTVRYADDHSVASVAEAELWPTLDQLDGVK